ncbi:MAG: carbohydrate ABC transporter substrate-binding protein, partial [Butyrivibrio sp.]|nr:carbohydrate ABC transporter substrate-binding protein [Butyrivibrio sp.]
MKKKLMSVLLAGTMVASLAACGTTGTTGTDTTTTTTSDNTQTETPAATETQDTTTTEAAATETAPAGDAGSVRLLNGKPEINDQMQALAAKYNEETGNTLIVETIGGDTNASDELKKMYQADNMPDIFVIEANQAANWDGMLADLAGEEWTNKTGFELVDASMGTIGFPYTVEATALGYNADILKAAGVDPASLTSPAAWKEACETLDSKKDELGITAVF